MDSPCALRGIEYSPLLGGVKTKAQSGQLACPKSQSGGESGSLQGSQACPLPERVAHHTDWDSSHGAPSGFGLCFLTEDTHMSHRTPLPCLTPACRPGCSPHFSCEEPKVWGGWGLTRSHTASSFVALRQPSERRASGSTLGWGSWGLGALPGPTYGLTAIPPPPSVFILFAAEDPLLRPAGPPLSAQPSHPCSTRPRGACSQGVFAHPLCRSFGGLGPSAAPDPVIHVPGPGSLWAAP